MATQLVAPPRLIPNPSGYPTYIYIGGIQATALVRQASVSITDVLNEQPNTASMTVNLAPHLPPSPPFHPPSFDNVAFNVTPSPAIYPSIQRGQPIEIYSGGMAPEQLVFAGVIVSVRQVYGADKPENVAFHLSCTDHTRALNRRKVTKSYATQSATGIVLDLMATFAGAGGFTTGYVQAGLPAVAIDFTFEEMNRALTRLANRIGGYWYLDYTKALHFFLDEPGDAPAPLVPGGERFADLQFESDLSQVRTRVVVEGAGTNVSTDLAIGETVIPIRDPVMFQAGGGLAIIGQQRITYTGVQQGGAGTLIGPGAQPGSAPVAAAAQGTGIDAGTHGYAVTFTSASGESLPSPTAAVTLGAIAPPSQPMTLGAPQAGLGPDPGEHSYSVTFVTPTGETTAGGNAGPIVTTQAGGVPIPGATAAALRKVTGNLQNGVSYRYGTTITTASGETLGGPASAVITPVAPAPPPYVMGTVTPVAGGSVAPGYYRYALGYVVGGYETTIVASQLVQVNATTGVRLTTVPVSADARVTVKRVYRTRADESSGANYYLVAEIPNAASAYDDMKSDAQLGALRANFPNAIGTPPGDQATVTIPSSADPRAVGRKIYRSDNSAPFRYLATINNTTATQYIDNTASVATDPDAPTTDTTGGALTCVVPISNIPIGPPAVTARKLYRTAANSSIGGLLTTINNNTATTFTDTKLDATLGGPPPPTNTTITQQVALSNIPTGGAGVTSRKVYRTAAGAAQLKLLTTIPNNTTTTYADAAADATLGANVPTTDTSGLQQPQGQVNAGATTIPVSSTSAFSPTGGFAVVGNGAQVLRYTSITATTITGVPASGPGALSSTVAYNSSITVAPALTGVSGIAARGIVDGEEIHLLVERNDTAAQGALAAIEGGDGIIEHYIQDRRLSHAGATSTADAELQLFSGPDIRVTYTTRDVFTRSGKPIAIDLPAPTNLVGTFLIQRVQLSRFDIPGVPPLRAVQASSTRFSFEDVLRRLELEVSA